MDVRWQPRPDRPTDPWSVPPPPGPSGASVPGWLEERLFDQRIVMIRGMVTSADATGIAAALLTLEAAGPAPVQLHVASPGGELGAAHAITDVIDSMAAPVHAVVTSEAGGAVLAVLAAAQQRSAYRHARFRLTEPRAAGVTGTADEVASAAGQHLRELEEMVLRLVEATGQTRSRIEDDLTTGRIMSATEARAYGLIDTVVGETT
ncbi:ATP-dependent Clp protease proteolytic subunit [Actinoplanes sp. NBRC 103695]|uniref:ATP-dependent Clp protease proteolytic subunit n=1 Tax=Actinoplanes sp. NBRC 103695 TaxID=3032202 RepID=UPI0024A45D04|nr:ATP-dependent Clp protease proteolytic subunit [Actinoplanes sp. NBRC 103695]GLY93565.1 ATP-dependent Clp protease proteolytic subunit [Actinoplanes sp. NBRC 103695]